ncbi:hypothetical protein FOZ60_004239 [Perkinsus olseni]|uniref:Uncharacterized protein n=1 Tax=Perkinsus olseni TaxID=32597 RepID=A0A7J6NTL0_PEROL|nr:hypothetical protein FOZ60_004239 [Perkinsus olseni]
MQLRWFALLLLSCLVAPVQSFMSPGARVLEIYEQMMADVAGRQASKFTKDAERTLRFCLLIGCVAVVLVGKMGFLRRLVLCLVANFLLTASAMPRSGGSSGSPPVMGVGNQAEVDIDQVISSLGLPKASLKGGRKSPSLDEVLKAIEIGTSVER